MTRILRTVLPALLAAMLLGALIVQPAAGGTPPNRLDPPGGGPVGLLTDACNSILGPFKDVADFFDLDVCPSVGGRVIQQPHIWNVFASDDWDAQNPASLSSAAINDITRGIIDTSAGNDYLGPAGQYGVGAATFSGSSQNDGCGGAPSGTTNFVSILLWITCEVQAPLTGIPYPDDNTLYVIYLPANVDVNNGPFGGTCDGFSAYHFWSEALTVDFTFLPPSFDASFQSYPFAVIPLKCAMDDPPIGAGRGAGALQRDWVSEMASHEIVEAATDPIVPNGWLDRSKIDFSDSVFKEGEAADICEAGKAVPSKYRRLDNGILVSPYWSNQDNACVPRLHTLSLKTVGLPNGGSADVTSRAIYGDTNAHPVTLPHAFCTDGSIPPFNADCITENARVSWSFPSPVMDGAGTRYVTGNTGDSTFMDQDITSTAIYGKQYLLTTASSPDVVKSLATTFTPTQWVASGSTIGVTTDDFVPSGVDRYRFRSWSWTGGDSSIFSSASILMDAPKTATADYVLQHQITFDETGIPGGVPWNVTVRGDQQPGPYSQWFDEFTSVGFTFQDPVPGLTPGTQYKLVSVDAGSPLSVTATRTVTATYKKQYLLTVRTSGLPSPNVTNITNGGTALGTANDSTPLQAWIDDGTALALAGDANVNGIDGTQYFAQDFSPAPPATMTGPFETTLAYKTMAQLIQEALAGGGMVGPNGPGVGTALTQQFAAVQADMGAKRYVPALNDLSAFVDLVTAQCCAPKTGMSITTPTAKTLRLNAMLVYRAALCLAANKLKPDQLADRYRYYQEFVTSLGGTVLPPCS